LSRPISLSIDIYPDVSTTFLSKVVTTFWIVYQPHSLNFYNPLPLDKGKGEESLERGEAPLGNYFPLILIRGEG